MLLSSGLWAADPVQQRTASAGAPRIGVALSGGGARGLAHIGVLKVLGELRVPVHCVTGTSMGAVVGGVFASGVSPAQMADTVTKTDWNQVFSDRPPRAEVSTRRKIDDYKPLIAPEFGLGRDGIALPKGVLSGVSIESYLRLLTGPAITNDFGSLPVPFRAVAADIVTGEAVVLERGSISQAMRASMSVPGAMAPVEIDGRLLVDGGIVNNLPIDEARKLCADTVIAVNISTPPLKREELTSAVSVSLQLINLLGKANVDRQLQSLGNRDVLIEPDLGDISAGSFDRAADAIRIGENAARALAEKLRRYSLQPEQYAALRERQSTSRAELGRVDEIRFEGLQRTNPEVLRPLVRSQTGEPLAEEKIAGDLRRIYGRGDYESVGYRIAEENGKRILLIQPREKAWGPDYLRFGVGFSTDFRGLNPFNILASYRKTWINRLGAEWLSELQVGSNPSLFTEFYQPLNEGGHVFVAPYLRYGQATEGVFVDGRRIADYRVQQSRIGLDFGAVLGTWGEARIGPVLRRVEAKVETGSPVLPGVTEDASGLSARLYTDHLDHAFFPRSGSRTVVAGYAGSETLGAARDYQRLGVNYTAVSSWGPHTFNINVAAGTSFHSNLPPYDAFSLGGPLNLSGYQLGEFSGRRMAFTRLMYYNRALPLPDLLGSGIYFGGSLEAGRIKDSFVPPADTGALYSGSIFLGADTFLGPAYFGAGVGRGGRAGVYLLLGAP
jgi:NTE family protein